MTWKCFDTYLWENCAEMPGCKGQVTKFVYHFVMSFSSCRVWSRMKSSLKPHCRSVPKPQVWETAVLLTASDMWTIHDINQDNDHMYIYKYTYMCIFLLRPFGTMQVAASKAWIHLYWASVTSLLYVCDDGWSLGRSAPQILLHAWSGIWPETLHQSQFPFGKEPAIGDGQSFPQAHG